MVKKAEAQAETGTANAPRHGQIHCSTLWLVLVLALGDLGALRSHDAAGLAQTGYRALRDACMALRASISSTVGLPNLEQTHRPRRESHRVYSLPFCLPPSLRHVHASLTLLNAYTCCDPAEYRRHYTIRHELGRILAAGVFIYVPIRYVKDNWRARDEILSPKCASHRTRSR
ncbi:hypothetical protein GGR52DRAFT_468931 [Hypoxylon sp. FL1284]|nr:hypothetical protein GGR52DRAFT_468931 [Hypoxylon sp. FL1284]